MLRIILLASLALAAALAKDRMPQPGSVPSEIFAHGSIRDSSEAVVEVAADWFGNIQTGQHVSIDVRQGQLSGVVKEIRSRAEITIALDGAASKVKLCRLRPGQAVIAIIELGNEMD